MPTQGLDFTRHNWVALPEIDRLGDLEDEVLQRNVLAAESGFETRVKGAAMEVGRGDVDPDVLERNALRQPRARIGGDDRHHALRKLRRHADVGGSLVKRRRRHDLPVPLTQAAERF